MVSYLLVLRAIGGLVGGWLMLKMFDRMGRPNSSKDDPYSVVLLSMVFGAYFGIGEVVRTSWSLGVLKPLADGIVSGYAGMWIYTGGLILGGLFIGFLSRWFPSFAEYGIRLDRVTSR